MSDATLNRFLGEGDDAGEAAFTPDPPTPASGPDATCLFINKEIPTAPILKWWDGSAFLTLIAVGLPASGGSNTQVQYNNSGVLAGITGATSDGTALTLVAPILGTPASGTLTNCTGLPTTGLVNDAVTFAKMQDIAADRLIGSDAGGDPAEITVGGGLEFTGSGGIQRSALTGDVTASAGSGSTTIANDAVSNTKLADMNALTVKVRAANSSGDPSDLALTDGHAAKRVGTAMVSGGYGPASVSVLTTGSGATYTVPAGVYRLRVRLIGAGGGGGGGDQGGGAGAGGGGGAGGYVEKVYSTTPGTTYTYTVSNTGGAGGLAGNNGGTTGADTTFDNGGSILTGAGGVGGGSMAAGSSFTATSAGTGGAASGGDVNIAGNSGHRGWRHSSTLYTPGQGACSSFLGGGGIQGAASAGGNATGYGAGGGGGGVSGTGDVAGGNGAPGVIIVEEYN